MNSNIGSHPGFLHIKLFVDPFKNPSPFRHQVTELGKK